jgi:hypothetical protein
MTRIDEQEVDAAARTVYFRCWPFDGSPFIVGIYPAAQSWSLIMCTGGEYREFGSAGIPRPAPASRLACPAGARWLRGAGSPWFRIDDIGP